MVLAAVKLASGSLMTLHRGFFPCYFVCFFQTFEVFIKEQMRPSLSFPSVTCDLTICTFNHLRNFTKLSKGLGAWAFFFCVSADFKGSSLNFHLFVLSGVKIYSNTALDLFYFVHLRIGQVLLKSILIEGKAGIMQSFPSVAF